MWPDTLAGALSTGILAVGLIGCIVGWVADVAKGAFDD